MAPVTLLLNALAAWLLLTPNADAHVLTPDELAAPRLEWTFTPWVVALLAASLVAYLIGYARLQRRGEHDRAGRRTRLALFLGGWLALAAALVSPLDTLGALLFSAHMVQHETMMLIAAPLCVLGRPASVWLWALPRGARKAVGAIVRARAFGAAWGSISAPVAAWVLHAAALWAWHAPMLFDAALANPAVHTLQHASFLITALLFWWAIFGEGGQRRDGGRAMLLLFTTMVHTSALGALITLAPALWYPSYVEPTSSLGLNPLRDQQLGGLIMWVPGALAYLIGALAVCARWLMGTPAPWLADRDAAARGSSVQ
ncbi:cytochrome c oxidase assembly protein [Paraburkholderia caballeronis]|uniref:Cytochrome c oxidase assembly factor CtaG n=1 Tax=Paraburkholderia caballeronis TaxID=416943 RepID=A0A1H7MVX0_9BURK|nr:cytochrome c oxidase assembly protein [Paraburkholderia caballeronis]PXW26416.1 cytochrome c oxidase assembly factor CtaG [Paraburkholderia caballeronis]PXX01963.1 cytochrome c oxidase assembly factor CtaG [Paraburkholderia caballeronis]RAK01120.1 cytochrome c oxidase assembly factor CtaG [Paraburkholderia caballeronis]SEB96871.1 Cytochrome c oxidase assembly factor CtaG [Paraburkholderia caballeronis]SEL14737.1 Cytochrome c oxidase assembly factor CtaG [Paraburkholderia caballeronis]